jgi:hypothetical protein
MAHLGLFHPGARRGPGPAARALRAQYGLVTRTIYDVAGLASVLTEAGQRVKTSAAEIEIVRSIDRNLALLFWVIAALTLYKTTWGRAVRSRLAHVGKPPCSSSAR